MSNREKATAIINIGKDYSPIPFGRHRSDNEFSGERFRDEILIPALEKYDTVIVELDDVKMSYNSSFLEETFGGL